MDAQVTPLMDDRGEVGDRSVPAGQEATPTLASRIGEIVWLLTQSPLHRDVRIADLDWMIMPPLVLGQYKIYRQANRPTALALWGYFAPDDEAALIEVRSKWRAEAWCGGDAKHLLAAAAGATPPMGESPNGQLWLVDLIAPGATPENRLNDMVLADLMATVFAGHTFKFHVTDPRTGIRSVSTVSGEARTNSGLAAGSESKTTVF